MDRFNPQTAPVAIDFDSAAALVTVRYLGQITASGLADAHEALIDALKGRSVVGLILDVRGSRPAYSTDELLESMEACIADLHLERIGVVAETDRERLVKLMETIAFAHGVRVRAFGCSRDAHSFAAGL
jgi:hypothetical protein